MSVRFALICAAVVVMVGGLSGSADAQIVTITSVQYKAAAGGNPATAEPKGTYSVTGAGTYQVVYDYGTINNGVFTANGNVAPARVGATLIARAGGNYNWTAPGPSNLNNPPPNLWCRARLQREVTPNNWVDEDEDYAQCP